MKAKQQVMILLYSNTCEYRPRLDSKGRLVSLHIWQAGVPRIRWPDNRGRKVDSSAGIIISLLFTLEKAKKRRRGCSIMGRYTQPRAQLSVSRNSYQRALLEWISVPCSSSVFMWLYLDIHWILKIGAIWVRQSLRPFRGAPGSSAGTKALGRDGGKKKKKRSLHFGRCIKITGKADGSAFGSGPHKVWLWAWAWAWAEMLWLVAGLGLAQGYRSCRRTDHSGWIIQDLDDVAMTEHTPNGCSWIWPELS